MSFVLLIPYVIFCFYCNKGIGYLFIRKINPFKKSESYVEEKGIRYLILRKINPFKKTESCFEEKGIRYLCYNILYFLLGASISGSLLLPTYLQYGILQGTGSIEANVVLNVENLKEITAIITRFLSFSSFEVGTFIGYNLESRLQFLQQYPWFAPFVVLLTLAGFLQIGYLIVSFWSNRALQTEEGKRVKYFTLVSVLLVYFSFLFSIKGPSPHTFYVILPVSMLYAFFCWQTLWEKPFWRKVATFMLVLGICFHLHLAHSHFHHHSLYKNRTLPQKAIDQKNYKILGNRRSEDWKCCY